MKKQIIASACAAVIAAVTLVTTVPTAWASDDASATAFSFTSDKTEVKAGDEVKFTVKMSDDTYFKNDQNGIEKYNVLIPSGLSVVTDYDIVDGGTVPVAFSDGQVYMTTNIYSSKVCCTDYVTFVFKCVVNDNASGELSVGFASYDDVLIGNEDNFRFCKITVAEPETTAEAVEPTTAETVEPTTAEAEATQETTVAVTEETTTVETTTSEKVEQITTSTAGTTESTTNSAIGEITTASSITTTATEETVVTETAGTTVGTKVSSNASDEAVNTGLGATVGIPAFVVALLAGIVALRRKAKGASNAKN